MPSTCERAVARLALLCVSSMLGALSCRDSVSPTTVEVVADSLLVQFGSLRQVPGATVQLSLVRVVEDTRCPSDATCPQPGNLILELQAEQSPPAGAAPVVFLLSPGEQETHAAFGYGIQIQAARPARLANEPVLPASAYWVTVRIIRLGD